MLNLLLFLFIYSNPEKACASEELGARGRLFRNAYTSTVVTSKVVTSLVPSSCVQVEPTLPPCRNVRYLRFPKLPRITFNIPANQEVVNNWRADPKIETTSLGWGEYFGLYAPTVTVTTTNLHISTVQDPSVVVTFAVKGCRPLKLPMDLDRCPQEYTSSITIEETLKTSTVATPLVSSATPLVLPTRTVSTLSPSSIAVFDGLSDLVDEQPLPDNSNLLEPSSQEVREDEPQQATATLGNK